MKIGIDARTLMDKNYSGVSEYTLNLLTNIFAIDKENDHVLFYNSGKDISGVLPEFDQKNVRYLGKRFPNKIFNYLLQNILHWPKIDQITDTKIYFLPHINFISLSNKCKKIITIHDLSFLKFPCYFSWRKNIWHRFINVKKLIRQFDTVVAVSENTKQDIIQMCGVEADKIKVIYSGINENFKKITNENILDRTKKKYNLPDKFILYLGTIEPRKNIESVIHAYEKLMAENENLRDIKLVIAGGDGWNTDKIYKVLNSSTQKDNIIFTGYVDNNDKPALYSLAQIFVYPSYYEGFGFPVLEAMACGAPVITSFTSSLPEICGEAAVYIDPYNFNELTRAIKQILADNDLREELINQGFEQIKKYSWPKAAQEYLNILTK